MLNNAIRTLEPVMAALGLAWAVLLVIDLTQGLSPTVSLVSDAIWVLFIVEFVTELVIAPRKTTYLKRHWLTAVSLALPVLRIARLARLLRVGRAVRGVRLVRTLGSLNRGMAALRAVMRRRGLSYVLALTTLVTVAGAAAMYSFENAVAAPDGIHDFGTALWWTAMLMTTMGSAYWPRTAEGRILCLLLAIYSFTIFGYLTAALSSFFVDRDARRNDAAAGRRAVTRLAREVAALRAAIERPTERR